jgi:hypothetical protein
LWDKVAVNVKAIHINSWLETSIMFPNGATHIPA